MPGYRSDLGSRVGLILRRKRTFSGRTLTADRRFPRFRVDALVRPTVDRPRSHQVPGLHLALPLDVDRPPSPAGELVLQQLVRRSRDLDLTWGAVRFHAARRVHGIAPEVVEEALRADHAGGDRP